MKSDINDLCEAFLAALTNAGYAVKSIENYKQVSNRFKKFCAENGYDTYTVINKSVPIIGGTEKLWKNKNAKQALYTLD